MYINVHFSWYLVPILVMFLALFSMRPFVVLEHEAWLKKIPVASRDPYPNLPPQLTQQHAICRSVFPEGLPVFMDMFNIMINHVS